MRRISTLILLILVVSTGFCGVEATLVNHYFHPGENLQFNIEISEPYSGTADLKFCLAEFDFEDLSYNYRCDIFLERHDINFDNTYLQDYTISLAGIQPQIYRLFVQLHYEDKYRKDSDSGNFIYITSQGSEIVYVYNPISTEIEIINPPNILQQGEEFSTMINISNFDNCSNFNLYSYVFKDSNCVTGEFNSNLIQIQLPYGAKTQIILNNTIESNTIPDNYEYKIRLSGCSKNYELIQPVIIIPKTNPNTNIELENNELIMKNFDSNNVNFTIMQVFSNYNNTISGSINPHTRKTIILNDSNYYLIVKINNNTYFEKLVINEFEPRIIYSETIHYTNGSIISANMIASSEENDEFNSSNAQQVEQKPFYILSLLTAIGALLIMYVKIR